MVLKELEMSADTFGNVLLFLGGLAGLVFLLLFAFSLVYVYRDAETRGKTGCLWLLIVFITWPFGLIAYWLLRDQEVRL